MTIPTDVLTYTVISSNVTKGINIISYVTTSYDEAQREAIKQAAATGFKQIIYTSTQSVDIVENWPDAIVTELTPPILTPA